MKHQWWSSARAGCWTLQRRSAKKPGWWRRYRRLQTGRRGFSGLQRLRRFPPQTIRLSNLNLTGLSNQLEMPDRSASPAGDAWPLNGALVPC